MFEAEDLMTREPWQQAHEREGSFIVGVDGQNYFIVRQGTIYDRLAGYISALTARGDMQWKEEIRKRPRQLDEHVYTAPFPETSLWRATLRQDSEHTGVCHLLITRLEEGVVMIHQPQQVINRLYYRLYKQYGHAMLDLSAFDDPDFRKSEEKDQRLLEVGLGVLERALERFT